MSTVTQADIVALLETSGARPRGNRHDCPKCGGKRTIAHTDECFYCHKCQWKGNTVTLQKELGIYQRIPSAEYREQCQKRERAHEVALRLYRAVHSRRMELLDSLHDLNRLEARAHDAGMDDESAWENLALVYREQPAIEAELNFLETASAAEIVELFEREMAV